jgi:hypothetical protein
MAARSGQGRRQWNFRETAIEQKTRPTPRPQIARKFVAVDMLNRW